MSDDDAAILPVRVSNRILARVNASSAEIGANARLAVVSPYVRHAAAAGRAQVEEEDNYAAAAVGGGVQDAHDADGAAVVVGVGIPSDQQEVVAGAGDGAAVQANQDEVDDAPAAAAAPAAGVQDQEEVNEICPLSLVPPFQAVYFNTTRNVYEYSQLLRLIHYLGIPPEVLNDDVRLASYISTHIRHILHVSNPINRQKTRRLDALSLCRPVSDDLQQRLHEMRSASGLPLADTTPITHANMMEFSQCMAIVQRAQAEHDRTANLSDNSSDDDSILQPIRWNASASSSSGGAISSGSRTASGAAASSAAAASSLPDSHAASSRAGRATSSTAASSSASTSSHSRAASSASRRRAHGVPHMQGFVYVQDSSGIGRTGIRSASHAAALISILQLAAANNEGGILGSLGPGGRTAWMEANHDDFYRAGGPLSGFRQISVAALMGHLRAAKTQARAMYDRDHSNDPTGVEHEDIPHWANLFFRLFEARDSIPSAAALAAEVRRERTSVVRSITGQQASLGSHTGPGTVQLRTETTRNVGSAFQRRRHIGNVNVERLDDNAMNALQEGRDDDYNQRPAQRRRFPQNGTRHRNATFGAGMNDPMSRYGSLEYGFESVGILSRSIRDSMNAPLPSPAYRCRRDLLGFSSNNAHLFFHLPYHPHDIPRRRL